MADFSSLTAESIAQTCRDNLSAIAESLNQCFDAEHELAVGDPADWSNAEFPAELAGPGLVVQCCVGDMALICAIPESLPLPPWYSAPSESQHARLETLAMEWSMNLLPAQFECENYSTTKTADLRTTLGPSVENQKVTRLPISIDGHSSRLWVLGPLPARIDADQSADHENVPTMDHQDDRTPAQHLEQSATRQPPPAAAAPQASVDPWARIRGINVPVIVKLAERRIEIEELLHLCPGTIVSFDKPCEDLLELMINNRTFALGEAVKIGEKFGLKISEVGYAPHREPRVLS